MWRKVLAHPNAVSYDMSDKDVELLDIINSLVPFELKGDKYSCLSRWLERAESSGLVTMREHQSLRYVLAPLI